jgi:carbon monoxide dehydrogenase subunit G
MKITGYRHIDAPQKVVESALLDGRRLVQALPDFRLGVSLDGQQQRGTLTIPVGPMRGQYEGTFTVTQPAAVVWEIAFDGHSAQGIFKGHGRIHLTPDNEQTILHYDGGIELAGQLAELPPRLLQANVNAIVRRCLDGFERILRPDKFVTEPESDVSLPAWLKTAVPAGFLFLAVFLLARFIGRNR